MFTLLILVIYCLFIFIYIFVFFFFFKQKTAYEMRISDWSSDVCSSDLRGSAECCATPCSVYRAAANGLAGFRRFPSAVSSPLPPASFQIGRASCRERVCQYV